MLSSSLSHGYKNVMVRSRITSCLRNLSTVPKSSDPSKPFDKILIANRGEIACRIIRTCKRLGVKTVAVYSEADAMSLFVREADEAYCIGPPATKDSYLRMDKILQVAKDSGAQGIHPGYGFLSENAKFADMVEHAGIAFIGPSSAPMNAMGDKIHSKIIAKNAGCYVIPGFDGEVQNEDHAVELANKVGYPIMIKASAGGGGKGMRVAYNDKEAREGFRLSKAEALSSFGDDRMLIERFIEDPHHIEIQVLADTHGNVVAFPERECSVQRRNQKVAEESPSCLLTPATRKKMQEQAILLCKATGYRSAGTIESLADGKQNFYFLEMNTRLQVEHPITELVSGEDLVEHMLWIAAGKALPKHLTDNPCRNAKGWAIESRVYSEDPLRNFLPSIGPLTTYKSPPLNDNPAAGPIVRLDTGVYEGGEISVYYDPMIAKLCTHAPSRGEAIAAMENALDQYVIGGLVNNHNFLRSIMRNPAFRAGKYGTKFIPEQYPKGFHGVELLPHEINELISCAVSIELSKKHYDTTADGFKYAIPDNDLEDEVMYVTVGGPKGKVYHVSATTGTDALSMKISAVGENGALSNTAELSVNGFEWVIGGPLATMTFNAPGNGKDAVPELVSRWIQFEGNSVHGGYHLRHLGSQQEVIVRSALEQKLNGYMLPPEVKDVSKFMLCPMPGTLVSISVKDGQTVEIGQPLAVIEAMKMQNSLKSPKAGVVKTVRAKAGQPLKVDQIILEFTE